MDKKNSARQFVRIMKEICAEEEIALEMFSYDWIMRLEKDGFFHYIFGYQFELNDCVVHSICCDKSAASEVMDALGIPHVAHYFFMSPENQGYVKEDGNWKAISDLLKKHGRLVCKANDGSGGKQVYSVANQFELENAVFDIFQKSRSMAVAPYYEIRQEYRAIVLDGRIKLLYAKQRPFVIGDGVHKLGELILQSVSQGRIDGGILKEGMGFDCFDCVPDAEEICYLNWKHNLGQGAYAAVVEQDEERKKICHVIEQVTEKMNLKFASVDIVECEDGLCRVLEINSGVMMESFSQQDDSAYVTAKEIYREAVLMMFAK